MPTSVTQKHPSTSRAAIPPRFEPGLDAASVDCNLRSAVETWQHAEHGVVLWFAEMNRRGLYKKLGFGTMHLYAAERLGFSQARSYQFLKLAERLQALPALEEAVATGELGWTKARAVARVATPKNEERWLERAKTASRRELEAQIDQTRRQARAARGTCSGQMDLSGPASVQNSGTAGATTGAGNANGPGSSSPGTSSALSDPSGAPPMDERTLMAGAASGTSLADMADLPVSITVQMDSEQLARYEALLAKLRQRGRREDKAELLLAALETLLDRQHQDDGRSTSTGTGGGATNSERRDKPARGANSEQRDSRARVSVSGPAYQILIQRCPDCEAASVPTSRGDRRISRAQLETALCDAKLKREGERNTSTLPPRVRKRALERDRHRCAMPGCRSRHFLHVHHIRAREDGGTHDLENLVTLCGACHRALHELSKRQQLAALGKGDTVGEPSARYTIAARQAIAELHSSNGNRQQDARL